MGRNSSRETDSSQRSRRAGKRRLEEDGDGATNVRSKRHVYTTIACNECKRRKVKCNGLKPCDRCLNLSLDCVFARSCCSSSTKTSDELAQMKDQIALLQKDISDLRNRRGGQDNLPFSSDLTYCNNAVQPATSRAEAPAISPVMTPGVAEMNVPRFHGHTSSIYGFDIAKSTLQKMGITHRLTENDPFSEPGSMHSPMTGYLALYPSGDPLWEVNQLEAMRLCRVYDEEIGIMYPHVDMDKLCKVITTLFTSAFISISLQTGSGQLSFQGTDSIADEDIMTAKMVIAIALLLEGSGRSDLSQRLYDSIKDAINSKVTDALNVKSLALSILTSSYHFARDEEAKSWRCIGVAARMCIEMGLHRRDSLTRLFPNETDYLQAVRSFWVVYALDRRLSFGTGLPFALQDQDIDPALPEPDGAYPYLKHITEFSRIAGKIWYENIAHKSGDKTTRDAIGFLDYQVLQWYSQLPESLTFKKDLLQEQEIPGRGLRRLRFLMYLRKNQARLSIYRTILYSATSMMENRKDAQKAVDVAKDTILTISGVNQISDLYTTQQVCYNYFLVQALGVIFLAVTHAPVEFCEQTRDEFCAVLDLINGFNTNSYVAKRLWRTMRVLREMGNNLGLLSRQVSDQGSGAYTNAAGATMSDLTNRQTNALNNADQAHVGDVLAWSPPNARQLNSELTSLFELAEEYGGVGVKSADQYNAYAARNGELIDSSIGSGEGMSALFGSEEEFSRIMSELF